MPFNFKLPQWNKSEPDPPQSKLDAGFGPGEKPSASLFNWFFNLVSAALSEIKNNGETTTGAQAKVDAHANNTSIHVTPADKTRWDAAANANPSMFASVSVKTSTGAQKGNNLAADQSADTLNIQEGSAIIITPNDATDTMTIAVDTTQFAPAAHVGAGGAAHAVATQSAAGFMAAADKTKLDGIATGAEVNQNTFATIAVKNNAGTSKGSVAADSKQDTATLREGTAILMTPDSATDEITISVDPAKVTAWDGKVNKTGDTMTGNLGMGGNAIIGVSEVQFSDGSRIGETSGQRTFLNANANRFDVITEDGQNYILKADYNAGVLQFKGVDVSLSTHTHAVATPTAAGFMSADDKNKLEKVIGSGAARFHHFGATNGDRVVTGADETFDHTTCFYNNLTINAGASLRPTNTGLNVIYVAGMLTINSGGRLHADGRGAAGGAGGSTDNAGGGGGGVLIVVANKIVGSGTISANGENGKSPVSLGTSGKVAGTHGTNGSLLGQMVTRGIAGGYDDTLTPNGGSAVPTLAGLVNRVMSIDPLTSFSISADVGGAGGGGGGKDNDGSVSSVCGAGGGGGAGIGGSGGRGGYLATATNSGWNEGVGGGGGGGGGVVIVISPNAIPSVRIESKGGNGGNGYSEGSYQSCGGGGGGGGGVVGIIAPSHTAVISVAGGNPGSSINVSSIGQSGSAGVAYYLKA